MMTKLEKPLFFKGIVNNLIVVFGVISGGVPFLIPDFAKINIYNIPLNWFILYIVLIVIIISYVAIYWYKVKLFYKKYTLQFETFKEMEKNREALISQYTEKQKEMDNLKKFLIEQDFIINSLENNIKQGICDISLAEKEYLKNIYEIIKIDKVHLYNLKGE